MDKVFDFLKEAQTFFYATADKDGQPHVRPYGFLMKFEGKIYFGMGKHKPSFKQTIDNPKFEICGYIPAKMQWIRIAGVAVLDDRKEVTDAVFADSPHLAQMYNEQTGNTLGNFYIKDAVAHIDSFAGGSEEIRF